MVKNTLIVFTALIILSSTMISILNAAENNLNLPSTPVRIEVFDGEESYFLTKLIDVPDGYDITNGTYLGWCIDTRAQMERSPAKHSVFLYSSLNPPGDLANKQWDMANYILNHKLETANSTDIQQAIWYFINLDGNYTPTSQIAWEIVHDALENGEGFTPDYGQIVAVICYPVTVIPHPSGVQISIIEVEKVASDSPPKPQPVVKQPIDLWIILALVVLLALLTLLTVVMIRKRKKKG